MGLFVEEPMTSADAERELATTLDTLISIVCERLAQMRACPEGEEGAENYYRARLGLAYLIGLRNRQA
jgi:hypothetical protein